MQGLHLTADLSGCKKNLSLMTDVDQLRRSCLALIEASGLMVVGELFHAFPGLTQDQAGGVTGTRYYCTVRMQSPHQVLAASTGSTTVTTY